MEIAVNMSRRERSRPTWVRSLATGASVGIAVSALLALSGVVVPSASAETSSAVTVAAKDQDSDIANSPLPNLKVTLSQTRDLTSQGVTVSWSGGLKSTVPGSGHGGENFLQIAQCWGDDATGPDRTTCQYGGFNTPGASRDNSVADDNVAAEDAKYTAPSPFFTIPTYTSIPFRSVDGKVIQSVSDDNKKLEVDVNTNEYFTQYTTNEVKWAGSGSDGAGSAKFEIQTALQAPGLGCGQTVTSSDGTSSPRSCWLVVIPRGTADVGEAHVVNSGLFWNSWKHRVAFRIDFKPLAATCTIGAAERQLSGSELIAGAVASWQPTLCTKAGTATYTLSTGTESDALASANGTATAPLALTSRALSSSTSEVTDSLTYAPVALTGLSIAFAIDRQPRDVAATDPEYLAKAGMSFSELKLTPRLVAKLLTNSYLDSLPTYADKSHVGYVSTAEPGHNARNLTQDPEFLAINDPEWAVQTLMGPSLADLLVPQGRSDAAWQLWRYVMSDQAAADFLAGVPDESGMIVNPWSATTDEGNSSGSALILPRDNLPKADPIEQAASAALGGAVNLVTWRPYTTDLDTSAYFALRGDGLVLGAWDAVSIPHKYGKSVRDLTGYQHVLALTDTASAAKYQIVSASLLNAAGNYVAPTTESLTAAAAAMTSVAEQPQVYEYDPAGQSAKAASNAYPLAMPVYAAANAAQTDADARADYAGFIRYAATLGQESGTAAGLLPAGYAPLPQGWREQAVTAANAIQSGVPAVVSKPTTASPTASSTTTSAVTKPTVPGAVAAASAAAAPVATGAVAAALLGNATPADPNTGPISAAVPGGLLAGLGAAAAVPLFSRIRRRS